MNIISIDVGVKNLAYCIFNVQDNKYNVTNWTVANLCNDTPIPCCAIVKKKQCNKTSKYYKNNEYYCRMHAKKQKFRIPITELQLKRLKKCKIAEVFLILDKYNIPYEKPITKAKLLELVEEYKRENYFNIIETVNANNIDLVTIGTSMMEHFNQIFNFTTFDDNFYVIIENQISPIANRMKTLQGMISQYFIMKGVKNIDFISSSNKLKHFLTDKKRTSYADRKKLGVKITQDKIIHIDSMNEWESIFTESKKKDDLADCYLQGLWFMNEKDFCCYD